MNDRSSLDRPTARIGVVRIDVQWIQVLQSCRIGLHLTGGRAVARVASRYRTFSHHGE